MKRKWENPVGKERTTPSSEEVGRKHYRQKDLILWTNADKIEIVYTE
jgi:hypothetical protein